MTTIIIYAALAGLNWDQAENCETPVLRILNRTLAFACMAICVTRIGEYLISTVAQ